MRFDVLTLFPQIFSGYLGESILNKAIEKNLVQIHLHNMRDWADNKHQKIDDRPYGGGPGMILMAQPVVNCVEDVLRLTDCPGQLIMLSPQGQRLDQPTVEKLAKLDRLTMICGRYEGFDQRISDILQPMEISIGDYVLNGGEVAAMVLIDAVSRLIPGVLGDERSHVDDSFSSGNRQLEFPQYTRPREFRGLTVPDVLLNGNHQQIALWRETESQRRTLQRRSDLNTSETKIEENRNEPTADETG
jgi:tRNA (guanine37-N1)-methyltransferase